MGNKVKFVVGALFLILNTGCIEDLVEEEEKFEYVYFSQNAKGWFARVQNENISFKSTNGLSEVYSFSIVRTTEYGAPRDVVEIGEKYVLSCNPSLGDAEFQFVIANVDGPENIDIRYSEHNSPISYAYINQMFNIKSPYEELRFYSYILGEQPIGMGLKFIGDTIINKIPYKDVFRNAIQYHSSNIATAVNEIYVSKSLGLVAFKTRDSIIWHRE